MANKAIRIISGKLRDTRALENDAHQLILDGYELMDIKLSDEGSFGVTIVLIFRYVIPQYITSVGDGGHYTAYKKEEIDGTVKVSFGDTE